MRGRRLLNLAAAVAMIAVAGPTRAAAPEPGSGPPSVCSPPCPAGRICVGQTCVAPDLRLPGARDGTPAALRPDPPPSPAGAAPTAGPPPGPAPDPDPPPPTAPPAPAYAPPPGYPAAPPPGYGYAAPPGYAYPPAPTVYAPDLKPPRKKRAFLLLPHFGLHSFQNREKSSYDPGGRLGLIIGGRIGDWFSLDADLVLDVSNTHPAATGAAFSQWWLDVAVGPLFQVPLGPIELVAGPKAGYFFSGAETRPTMGPAEQQRASGFVVGLDAGVFVPVWANTSVGGLLSYEIRNTQHACRQATGLEMCTSVTTYDRLFGLSLGALF